MELLKKMRGDGASPPPRSSLSVIVATVLAAVAVIGGLSYLTHALEVMLLLGTFGASNKCCGDTWCEGSARLCCSGSSGGAWSRCYAWSDGRCRSFGD